MNKINRTSNIKDAYFDTVSFDRIDAQNEIDRLKTKIQKDETLLSAISEVDHLVNSFYDNLSNCITDNGEQIVIKNSKKFVNAIKDLLSNNTNYQWEFGESIELIVSFSSTIKTNDTSLVECEIDFIFNDVPLDDETMSNIDSFIENNPTTIQGKTADYSVYTSVGIIED